MQVVIGQPVWLTLLLPLAAIWFYGLRGGLQRHCRRVADLCVAAANDVILVAGKGHENYQLIGSQSIDFSDYGVALANLSQRAEGTS